MAASREESVQMGFQKTRFSELVFFGCLVVLLGLRSSLRPSHYSDVFPYGDPFTEFFLYAMNNMNNMNNMNFAMASESYSIRNSSSASITFKFSAFDDSFSRLLFGDCGGQFRCFPGKEEEEKDVRHKFDARNRPWYMESTTILNAENDVEDLLYASNVPKEKEIEEYREAEEEEEGEALEDEEEEDEEQIKIFFKHQTPHQDNIIHPFWLMNNNFGADDHTMSSVGTLFNNGLKLTTKVVSIIFGVIVIFLILSKSGWKRMKNKEHFISNNRLYALIFDESKLDNQNFNDEILYKNLLNEAKQISEGSSGIVFKVMFYGIECAMKVFYSNARMDFKNESITAVNLDHPHIINFICVFRKSFIIMELMDEDLYSFITKIRERHIKYDMPLEVALDLILQIAEGMSYLHNQGIAHQDLKSKNILLKSRGEFHALDFQIIAKIADFGSARSFDPRCPEGFVLLSNENIGTRFWRAPELFHPRGGFSTPEEDSRIMPKPLDIYGFAIICSELVTMQIPFSNNNDQTIVLGAKIRDGHRPALPSDGCPGELIALIKDCWKTNPSLRPEFHEICTRLKQLIKAKAS